MPTYYEFFCGGGMVRAGLGSSWNCLFANDIDHKKAESYAANWGRKELCVADVTTLTTSNLPNCADLAWASFPCQDLSLAGAGAGLEGERSGTFWPFWMLMKALIKEDRAPDIVVLENVCGALTSHGGKDFVNICSAFARASYNYGAVVIDAALFVPQSRPRLFIIGVKDGIKLPLSVSGEPSGTWHTRALRTAYDHLPAKAKKNWHWWNFPSPVPREVRFTDLIEDNPDSVEWHSPAETRRVLAMMSSVNLAKIQQAKRAGRRMVGAVYKRTRQDEFGSKMQRAEVRFDDIAGCLRTPAGGSSRQVIVVVDGRSVKSRLISSRETARLMGLSDSYILPENYNEAYHLTGDGVVTPVVRHLAANLLEPILALKVERARVAA